MSPELFDPEIQDHRRTKHSDCYALGMVIYEVLSGRIPFYRDRNLVIPGRVVGGGRPERPQGAEGVWFTDEVWEVMERCWMPQPGNRPNIEDVRLCMERVSESWTPPLMAVSSSFGSLARGFSDGTTAESTDQSVVPSPSQEAPPQLSGKLDLEEYADAVNGVGQASPVDGFRY